MAVRRLSLLRGGEVSAVTEWLLSFLCGLDSIQVGTHETNPTEIKCTDCESFKLK